ncbi:MAG: branched-chain amino acid ABC transporter permease [Actinomycetota bacterium]|nr:branched-chain amino acid ABC transporter permease [Actinomycetota bacterium]
MSQLQSTVGPRRLAVGAVGAMLAVVGSFAPWAAFFFGYAGKVTLSGFPGGARLFCVVLVVVALGLVVDAPGRGAAGTAGAIGILLIAGGNLLGIAYRGGGLGAVAWGAWVTVVGGLLMLAAFLSFEPDAPVSLRMGDRVPPLQIVIVAAVPAAILSLVVWGLRINESSRFLSFLAFLAVGTVVLQKVGVVALCQDVLARYRPAAIALGLAAATIFPFTQHGSAYWLRVFASVGVFACAAIGLNVVVGLAGLLDLGYIAFFGTGAYIGGLLANARLTTVHVHLPFVVVIFVGASVAGLVGLFVGAPTLRLRGDYLAIVTLGFGEIFRITANNWDGLTRGPNGIAGIPDLKAGSFNLGDAHKVLGVGLPSFANYYFVELILLVAVVIVFTRLNDSRIGRAWVAIREDETAAAAMGVNTIRLKLLAFATGAFLAGAAGTINAHVTTQVSPDSYTFLESILLVAAVVLGGMGTVPGALLGSTILFVIPEKLRSFQDKRLLFFGLALIIMMRFRPEGIVASRRRQRELHDTSTSGAVGAPPGAPVASV